MVKIAQYRATQTQQVPSRPNATIKDFVGPAVEGLGAAMTNFGGALYERQQKRDAFEIDTQYRRWKAGMEQKFFDYETNMPEGGNGFAKTFLAEAFDGSYDWVDGIKDPDMRNRVLANIEADRSAYLLKGSRAEQKELVRFQTVELEGVMNQAANMLAMDPDRYDEVVGGLSAAIANSNLPAIERGALSRAAEQIAMRGYLDGISTDPVRLYRELGGDLNELPDNVRAGLMTDVLIEKGAVGKRQMDIEGFQIERVGDLGIRLEDLRRARDFMGDPGPADDTLEGWSSYLTNPNLSTGYTRAVVELVNRTQPETAAEFFTRFYFGTYASGETLANLPRGVQSLIRGLASQVEAPTVAPSHVKLLMPGGGELAKSSYDEIDPLLTNIILEAAAQMGQSSWTLRDWERKDNAGYGAKNSQHILYRADGTPTGRRGAYDLDVSHMSVPERVKLIEVLSSLGVTGIGVYGGSIHVDLGPRRYWGPSYGAGSEPAWARDVLKRHASGQISTASYPALDPKLQNVDPDVRRSYLAAATRDIGASTGDTLPEMRAQAAYGLDQQIAAIRQTGQAIPGFDFHSALDVLTPASRMKYEDDIYVAQEVFSRSEALKVATTEDLITAENATLDAAGEMVMPREQRVRDEVAAEIEAIKQERLNDPSGAAFNFPEVRDAFERMREEGLSAEAMQEYIRVNLDVQRRFFNPGPMGTPDSAQPITRQHAAQIAGYISALTRRADLPMETRDLLFGQFYMAAQTLYGDYADEVLYQAMQTLRGAYGSETQPGPERTYIDEMVAVITGGETFLDTGDVTTDFLTYLSENFDEAGMPLRHPRSADEVYGPMPAPGPEATTADPGSGAARQGLPGVADLEGLTGVSLRAALDQIVRVLSDMDPAEAKLAIAAYERQNPQLGEVLRSRMGDN